MRAPSRPAVLWERTRPHVVAALPAWVIARGLVLGAWMIARLWSPVRHNTTLGLFAWDGRWYRTIATTGYTSANFGCRPTGGFLCQNLRFFPLYPLLGRWLGALLLGRSDIGLLLLANIPALGLAALAHHLCIVETGDRALARRVAWLMALAPPAFVLVLAYTEPLSLAAAMLVILCARRRQWAAVIAVGFLAGLLRPVGVLLAVPGAWEAWRAPRLRQELLIRAAAVAAPVLATVTYLLWAGARFGQALLPYSVQAIPSLRGGFVNPVLVVFRAFGGVMTGHVGHQGHLITVLVLVVLVIVCWTRWPVSYALFVTVSVLTALAAQNLGSLERYGYDAFPLVFTLAGIFASKRSSRIMLVLCGAGMVAYAAAAFIGAYVP